jgi:hypothetical protein
LVRQILLPGNVSWQRIATKDRPLFHGKPRLACAWPTGNLAARIDERTTINVGPGILGMTQDAVQCGWCWLSPLQPSFVGAFSESDRDANSVLAQVPEHLPSRAKLLELLENQSDDRLDLLIGIEDYLT